MFNSYCKTQDILLKGRQRCVVSFDPEHPEDIKKMDEDHIITAVIENRMRELPDPWSLALTIIIMSQWGSQIPGKHSDRLNRAIFFVASLRAAKDLQRITPVQAGRPSKSGHEQEQWWRSIASECLPEARGAELAEHLLEQWRPFTSLLCLSLRLACPSMQSVLSDYVKPNLETACYAIAGFENASGLKSTCGNIVERLLTDLETEGAKNIKNCWKVIKGGAELAASMGSKADSASG